MEPVPVCMSLAISSSISPAIPQSCSVSTRSKPLIIYRYHLAEKKIKHWDSESGKVVAAEKNNGVKFELFYFDVFEETDKIGLFETIREEEFAPLKNATGDDSPESARQYLKNLHRKWLID